MLERIPISLTFPSLSPNCTVSPTCIGLSNISMNPDIRLLIRSCNPKPIPTPSAPIRMVSLVISTPSTLSESMKPMVIMVYLTIRLIIPGTPRPNFILGNNSFSSNNLIKRASHIARKIISPNKMIPFREKVVSLTFHWDWNISSSHPITSL